MSLPAYAAVEIATAALGRSRAAGGPLAERSRRATSRRRSAPIRFDDKGDLTENPYRLFRFDGDEFRAEVGAPMMFRTGPRNLITDVAGLRVGNAADARLKSGVTVVRLRRAGGRRRAGARRRAGHARDRPARAAQFGRGGQCPGALRRLGLRPRRRLRRAGGAAREGRRLRGRAATACRSCRRRSCSTCAMAATRTGAAIRPIASSATRRRRPRRQRFRDRHRRAPAPAR